MLHLLPLLLLGCTVEDIDGTWRHPAGEGSPTGQAWELALGQYGPEVAGLVRLYEGSSEPHEPYLRRRYCSQVDAGRVMGNTLRFQFDDPDGQRISVSLATEEIDVLSGTITRGVASPEPVRFVRVDTGVDRRCEGRARTFTVRGLVVPEAPGELPSTLRVTALFTGIRENQRFLLPRAVTKPDRGGFALEMETAPDPQVFAVAHTDGSVAFAYAVFAAFDDINDDGRWDRGILGAPSEPMVGVDPDLALAYLEGRGAAVFPAHPQVARALVRGWSLVSVAREQPGGPVTQLVPVDPETKLVRIAIPSEPADLPLPGEVP